MNNIKRILIVILALAAMAGACLVVTTYSEAKESQIIETLDEKELEVINGEEIGIVINTQEKEEVEIIEAPSHIEEDKNLSTAENDNFETESPEVPEGLSEGYEEGVYFEPNCFDCELHEYCYKCEQHEIETEYFYDEEINPNSGWVYSETCVICGHGECRPATEDEIE